MKDKFDLIRRSHLSFGLAAILLASACAPTPQEAKWPPTAKKWFDRAAHSYQTGDLDDARLASDNALAALPNEPEVRLVAAQVAMAELEFDRALQLLAELPSSEAAALRGRCYWYKGDLELAADELAVVAADPDVKDEWGGQILELARSGRGRRPFEMTGGLVAAAEMPRAGNTSMLVPVEINGEPSLAMISTDQSESVIDARESSWVSLRFGGRVEVSDVPAVSEDLSGLTRQVGVPVKMLIGVHLLRRLRATIDLSGRQFVVRNFEPPPPPSATTIAPIYYKGGALVLPGAFGEKKTSPAASLLMNTSITFPLALDDGGWKKAGRDPDTFVAVPGANGLRHGTVPMLRLGAFEIPSVPGVSGLPVDELEEHAGIDVDGMAGSGLFATFRLTFADQGRTLWMEDLPPEVIAEQQAIMENMRRDAEARSAARAAEAGVAPAADGTSPASGEAAQPAASPAPAAAGAK